MKFRYLFSKCAISWVIFDCSRRIFSKVPRWQKNEFKTAEKMLNTFHKCALLVGFNFNFKEVSSKFSSDQHIILYLIIQDIFTILDTEN